MKLRRSHELKRFNSSRKQKHEELRPRARHSPVHRRPREDPGELPHVQEAPAAGPGYYAVKANSNQEIIKTLFDEGASFDVASYNEFMQVYEYIRHFEEKDKDFYIWDKIIFSNTIKDKDTLRKIRRYRPLVTFDNADELRRSRSTATRPAWSCGCKVPDTGSQVEMSSKFGAEPGDARGLIDRRSTWAWSSRD